MKSSLTIIAILVFAFIVTIAEGKNEVLIHLDKEKVSVGDYITVSIYAIFEKPSPIDVLISGKSGALWLCKNESKVLSVSDGCGNTSWKVKIPENWESGDYFVKVNVHQESSLEFSKTFKVIRPKIVEIKVPELVYQGKKEVTVKAEIADSSKAKLYFRLLGLNFRLDLQSDFDKDGVARFEVDLRGWQGEPLKPGYYVAELKLFYDGKFFDSRSLTVEIVRPKLSLSFSEEIKAGETLRVELSTNRDGDAGYGGIFVVLVGKNYREVRQIELDKDGKAKVTFETAGLDEGYYTLYVRDTSLTLRNIDFRNFSNHYYALDPSESSAKFFYAHDDILIFKTLRIVKEKTSKPTGILIFEPISKEINCGDVVEFEVFLLNLPTGLSGFELRFLVSNSSVARMSSVITPNWANEVYKVVFNESAKLKVFDIENKVREAEKLLIAKVKLLGVAEGVAEISADVIQLNDDEGNLVATIVRNAVVSVSCRTELQGRELENGNIAGNSTEIRAKTSENESENLSSQFIEKSGKLPRPRELEMNSKDILLALTTFFAFTASLLGRRLNYQ